MQTELSVYLCLLLAGTVLPAVLACGGVEMKPHSSLEASVGRVPPELAADYESFAVNCSKCHQLERALAAPVTDKVHWDMYVAKMMRTAGSAIHPDEAPHILRFLYWYTDRKSGRPTSGPSPAKPTSEVSREVTAPESSGDTRQPQGESTP